MLDLFCGEGGAGAGYHQAGFDVVGVDIKARPRYPFDFHQGDALAYVAAHGHEFDVIHASPPCQRYTHGNVAGNQASKHPDLIGVARDALMASGKAWVIENVPRAPLRGPIMLCGSMFDLSAMDDDGTPLVMERHRLFESNVFLTPPAHPRHPAGVQVAGSYGGARRNKDEARNVRHGGYVPSAAVQAKLLRVDWMSEQGQYLCIPPVYARYVGAQLLAHIRSEAAA